MWSPALLLELPMSCPWAAPSSGSGWPLKPDVVSLLWICSQYPVLCLSWQRRVEDCFLGQVWDWHIRQSTHRFYYRFITVRDYIWQFYIALVLLVYCVRSVLDVDVSLQRWCIPFIHQLQNASTNTSVFLNLFQPTDSLLHSPLLWCSSVYQVGSHAHKIVGLYPVRY